MNIDFSVTLSDGTAFGYVEGKVDLSTAPMTGDVICLAQAGSGHPIPEGALHGGQLRLATRLHRIGAPDVLTVSLEDMVVADLEAATRIGMYLEAELGLHLNAY